MSKVGALVEELISIKDGLRNDLYVSQIDALNDACNIIYHNFPSDADVSECIDKGKENRRESKS
jgi:hypothetical protein